jgi:hypothetical protein
VQVCNRRLVLSTDEFSYGTPCEQRAGVRISDAVGGDGEPDFAYSRMAFGYDGHVSHCVTHWELYSPRWAEPPYSRMLLKMFC